MPHVRTLYKYTAARTQAVGEHLVATLLLGLICSGLRVGVALEEKCLAYAINRAFGGRRLDLLHPTSAAGLTLVLDSGRQSVRGSLVRSTSSSGCSSHRLREAWF